MLIDTEETETGFRLSLRECESEQPFDVPTFHIPLDGCADANFIYVELTVTAAPPSGPGKIAIGVAHAAGKEKKIEKPDVEAEEKAKKVTEADVEVATKDDKIFPIPETSDGFVGIFTVSTLLNKSQSGGG